MAFEALQQRYEQELTRLVETLQQDIRYHTESNRPDALERLNNSLSYTIGRWLEDFIVQTYPIELKQAARAVMSKVVTTTDQMQLYDLQDKLDSRMDDLLKSFSPNAPTTPTYKLSSPYLKPVMVGGVALAAAAAAFYFTEGLLITLISQGLIVIVGSQVILRVFRHEKAQNKATISRQSQEFVTRFERAISEYLKSSIQQAQALVPRFVAEMQPG